MKRLMFLTVMLSAVCFAENFTLQDGSQVSGSVVSSVVAQVWIKTPSGTVEKIPVKDFKKESRKRLPSDAAGVYVDAVEMSDLKQSMIDLQQAYIGRQDRIITSLTNYIMTASNARLTKSREELLLAIEAEVRMANQSVK